VRLAGSGLARLQESTFYDRLMRLPMLSWASFLALASAVGLASYIGNADPGLPGAVYAVGIAMRLSTIAFLALLAVSTLLRGRPTGRARGIEPRISALIGGFVITGVVLFPRTKLSLAGESAATLLILTGNALAVFVLTQLGRSFSVMAEARRLVTSGLYRFVRHPLYLAEEIASIGVVMQFLSWRALLLLAVQIAFQLRRIQNEEAVLGEIFPDYADYRAKTARLIPGVY
jgi:protein-S-isoprenylcysteine O-methyltransferase Ste14